jgi:putative hydrolase of the HAD superfamily
VRPAADAHACLDALAARGFRLGVVSNSNGRVRSLLEAAGLAAPLGCVVDSGVVGVEKPDPRIFAIAAERLGAAPAACVYVGDFHSLDVLGARAAGMYGVLLDPLGVWDGVAAPRVASLTELVARLPARAATVG